jgi:hypothetical protein
VQVLRIDPSITITYNFLWLGEDSVSAKGLVAVAQSKGLFLTVADILKRPILSDIASSETLLESQLGADYPAFSLGSESHLGRFSEAATMQCNIKTKWKMFTVPLFADAAGSRGLSIKEVGSYTIQSVFSLPASLNVARLKAVWQTIASSQPILRTRSFEYASDGLFQVVLKEAIQWQNIKGWAMILSLPKIRMTLLRLSS